MSEVKGMHTQELTDSGMPHQHLYTSVEQSTLTSDFLVFVSTKQSHNSILNRMLTSMIFQWSYERLLPTSSNHRYGKITQGEETEKKVVERCNWTSWGSRREMKPVIV